MKIAILQLARIGDIFQTAPAINAYKRLNKNHTVDLIVRNKFSEACDLLKNIDSVIELPTKHILKPLIQANADITTSITNLENWILHLASQDYDKVINLSFSPLSSWITFFLQSASQKQIEVAGYTRTSDGFLSIPDDMSAYVYAQCGPGYPNRFHLAEIFGTLLGVDLLPEDWDTQELKPYPLPFDQPYICIQTRASAEHKSIPPEKIAQIVNTLKKFINLPIVLLGSNLDSDAARIVLNSSTYQHLFDYTGKTALIETAAIIKHASLFIGPDSSLQNIASLTGTKTLLLSIGNVNFFETGPRAKGSFVISDQDASNLEPESIAKTVVAMLYSDSVVTKGYYLVNDIPCYKKNGDEENLFKWELINYIYRGLDAPKNFSPQFELAVQKLYDVNQFAIEILEQVNQGASLKDKVIFLEQAEEIISAIEKLCDSIAPIIAWYRTEKMRIGPGPHELVLQKTLDVHKLLDLLCTSILEHCRSQSCQHDLPKEEIL